MSKRLTTLRTALLVLLLPAASALLLALSFPPWDWTWLAWIALVPFAAAMAQQRFVAELYVGTYVGGVVFHLIALDWIRTSYGGNGFSGPWAVCWQLISLTAALSWPLALAAGRALWRWTRLPMTLVLPLAWVTAELARRHAATIVDETGFPWLQLGHTQAERILLVQVADLGGVYLVTFIVATANGALYDFWRWLHASQSYVSGRLGFRGSVAIAACLLIASFSYGCWRIGQNRASDGPTVCLMPLASVVDPFALVAVPREQLDGELVKRDEQSPEASSEGTSNPADLLVWCEGALDTPLICPAPREETYARDQTVARLERLARDTGSAILIGSPREDHTSDPPRRYNSAAFVDSVSGYIGSYDKVYLVPWNEFTPWHGIPFGTKRQPYHYSPGASYQLFTVRPRGDDREFSMATTICYDVCFPELFRQFMRSEAGHPRPDFFVVISGETFDGTDSVAVTHLRMARFRAIECRRAVLRNVNGGYSGLVDGNGRIIVAPTVTTLTQPFPLGRVPIDDRFSLYARFGDWPLIAACLAVVANAMWQARVSSAPMWHCRRRNHKPQTTGS